MRLTIKPDYVTMRLSILQKHLRMSKEKKIFFSVWYDRETKYILWMSNQKKSFLVFDMTELFGISIFIHPS